MASLETATGQVDDGCAINGRSGAMFPGGLPVTMPAGYQSSLPASPLKGPTTSLVTQPP